MPRHGVRADAPALVIRESPSELIHRIADNALAELRLMMGMLGQSASARDFSTLEQCIFAALSRIGALMESSGCCPWTDVKHSPGQPSPVPSRRVARIGVFPIAANPLHWAHVVGGLSAIESFGLDKVIYVIAGEDPRKPSLAPPEARYRMARTILQVFFPLFECSSIAQAGSACGEENLFTILAMNPRQPIHAFYIAGSDHCYRVDPRTGGADTIAKLEAGINVQMRGSGGVPHSVTAVFLERDDLGEHDVTTTLDVRWLPGPPVHTSSTAIRSALPNPARWETLSSLPFGVFSSILENHLYHVDTETLPPPAQG